MLTIALCVKPAALHCVRDSCRLRYFRPHSEAESANFSKASTPSLVIRAAQSVLESEQNASARSSLDWSQPRRRNCTLHFLRPHLHAFTYMAPDALLVAHWLKHYIELGIPTRNLAIHMRSREDRTDEAALNATLGELARSGVQITRQVNLTRGHFLSTQLISRSLVDAVNAYLQTLPSHAWVILADSDEFFSMPCGLARLIRGRHDAFLAKMVDRLAADGSIPPLAPSPDISVQYPIECLLRQALSTDQARKGGFFTSKVALFRAQGFAKRWPRKARTGVGHRTISREPVREESRLRCLTSA